MREIKFRGKSGASWVFGYFIYNNFEEPTICNEDGAFKVDELSVGQFTGLKDKNGKEIYEGDLLKIDMEKFGCDDTIYEVRWEYDGYGLYDRKLDSDYVFHDKDRQEVIGNIYENPELLTPNK